MSTQEFFNSVLPKFQGTEEELLQIIEKLSEDTHEQWVKDIEKQEAKECLAKRFQA